MKFNLFKLILDKNNLILKIISLILIDNDIRSNGLRLRLFLEELGPIFIKLGQILSTRNDIFTVDIINELKKLQTNVKPIEFKEIKKFIEKSLKSKIKDIFTKFNENPLSSASIAQIHTAILNKKEKVVIKILKPNVPNLIKIDISILKFFANFIISFNQKLKRLKILDVISELEITFKNEVDLTYEIANLTKIKKNLTENKNFYIPKIYWEFSNKKLLVIEYIDGIAITNKKKLTLSYINTYDISKKLINLFFTQAFKYKFFHADLHPGNILIAKNSSNIPIIILIDFGITHSIDKEEIFYLAENILAFTKKDYKKIAVLHLIAKTIQTDKSLQEIENELCFVFEPLLDKKIKEISMKETIKSIMRLGEIFNMQTQPQLIFFQKTLLNIESICRDLTPNINMWNETRLCIEKIFLKELLLNKFKQNITTLISKENINKNLHKNIEKNLNQSWLDILFSNGKFHFALGYLIGTTILFGFFKYYQTSTYLL